MAHSIPASAIAPQRSVRQGHHRLPSRHSLKKLLLIPCLVLLLYFNYKSFTAPNFYFSSVGNALKPLTTQAPRHPCVSTTPPISNSEYMIRQTRLAEALQDLNGVAYIAEPGAQTQFFANFSSVNWKLSERPLLVIITAQKDEEDDKVKTKVSLLAPKFEATRAKLLPIPFVSEYILWAEEEDPYAIAVRALNPTPFKHPSSSPGKIYVDNSARHFHYDGLQRVVAGSGLIVTSAPKEINQLRERKSEAEIEILKCTNEATLLAVRYIYGKMYIGMRESEARNMMSTALTEGGLSSGGCLTLFGKNAALPHGNGTDKVLESRDLALFDCTAALHGYWSDITRTVALPSTEITIPQLIKWQAVRHAQRSAILAARSNATARTIDEAARSALRNYGGLDKYFTHRLGHGIGLEVHEPPYLNGGSEDIIQPGHTFSNEPGVYIEGEIGIRLEDCFFINNQGEAVYLTAGLGGPSLSPYKP